MKIGLFSMKFNPFNEFQPNNIYCQIAVGILGAAAVGAASTAYAASQASSAQRDAANQASQTQRDLANQSNELLTKQYDQTRTDLAPYRQVGDVANTQLQSQLPFLTTPIQMSQEQRDLEKPITLDQATLEATPGYQFALNQGLKATQNAAAARGLGVSGAALKGAAAFATGLADNTYTNQFNLAQQNRQNAFGRYQTDYQNQLQTQGSSFDRLNALLTTGENAAAQTSALGNKTATTQASVNTTTGQQIGSNVIGAGNATAAGYNAIGSAVAQGANNIGGYAAYRGLYGNNSQQGSMDPGISGGAIY